MEIKPLDCTMVMISRSIESLVSIQNEVETMSGDTMQIWQFKVSAPTDQPTGI